MNKGVLLLLSVIAVLSCNNPKNKVTYYEQHDDCELMSIIDTEMAMNKFSFTDNIDLTLASALKTHHLCGMAMADYELENGEDEEMKKQAQQMRQNDTMELIMLDSFLQQKSAPTTRHESSFEGEIKRTIDKMQHSADLQLLKDDDDHDYAMLILPQRQCNLDLSELIIHYSNSPLLKKIADNIQQNESLHIELLQLWLLKNGKK